VIERRYRASRAAAAGTAALESAYPGVISRAIAAKVKIFGDGFELRL